MYVNYSYMYILTYYVCIYVPLLYVSVCSYTYSYVCITYPYIYTAVALLKSLRETEGWSVASKLSTEDIQMRLISRFVNEVGAVYTYTHFIFIYTVAYTCTLHVYALLYLTST